MRVFRTTYKGRDGKEHKAPRFYVELRGPDGRMRRLAAYEDRSASKELGNKLRRLAELKEVSELPSGDLLEWVRNLESRLRKKLLRLGFLDPMREAGSTAVNDLLEDFTAALRARGCTEKWVKLVSNRVRATLQGSGIQTLSSLNAAAVERHLHEMRREKEGNPEPESGEKVKRKPGRPVRTSISTRESNHRLQACREFARWAVERGLLVSDPLAILKPLNARLDPRHVRRALRPEELRLLIQRTHDGPTIRSVIGPTRAMAWRLGCEAGLRIGEIVSLRVGDLDLDAPSGPILTIRASVSKNRREARLPLHAALARDLAPYTLSKLPTASLLGLPTSFRHSATIWLEKDIIAAGLKYTDESGRVADVHSLRSAFITHLVRSGANVKAVQILARHASPMETVGIYTRLSASDEREAIDSMPSMAPGGDELKEAKATGTDGSNDSPSHSPLSVAGRPQGGAGTCPGVPNGGTDSAVSGAQGGAEWRGRRDSNPQPPA